VIAQDIAVLRGWKKLFIHSSFFEMRKGRGIAFKNVLFLTVSALS
jgi:hypothetical protein